VEIVAFTSSDSPALAEAMLDAGASRHFAKPDVGRSAQLRRGREK
jgi:hypothetical protein